MSEDDIRILQQRRDDALAQGDYAKVNELTDIIEWKYRQSLPLREGQIIQGPPVVPQSSEETETPAEIQQLAPPEKSVAERLRDWLRTIVEVPNNPLEPKAPLPDEARRFTPEQARNAAPVEDEEQAMQRRRRAMLGGFQQALMKQRA
jgi:hypothetical protein